MSSSHIKYLFYDSTAFQYGNGVPNHISPLGSVYVDNNTGIMYINKDGVSTWNPFYDSTNKPLDIYVTGGSYNYSTGIATFNNNNGGSFSLYGFNVGGGGGGTFTGGTILGATTFINGLTSTTITSNSISATTYYNLPKDIYVTGGTYSNGTSVFTNNTGGTFTVTGLTTPFTGGTVNGLTATTISATTYQNLPISYWSLTGTNINNTNLGSVIVNNNSSGATDSSIAFQTLGYAGLNSGFAVSNIGNTFANYSYAKWFNVPNIGGGIQNYDGTLKFYTNNLSWVSNQPIYAPNISATTLQTPSVIANSTGLSATTISATTYQNLPMDISVTGGTYNNNTFTFTNNTGGTYNVLFNTMTGLTINGKLTTTGNTSLQSVSATTISATTYYNLPIKYYAEYSGTPTNSPLVTNVGGIAIGDGANAKDTYVVAIGTNAGYNSTGTNRSVFLGEGAGYGSSGSTYCTFLGEGAGNSSTGNTQSTYIGTGAGNSSTGNTQSNFIGYTAGKGTNNLSYSNVMGFESGRGITNAVYVNMFGHQAGWFATNANNSNFIGVQAGSTATNASYSNFIGRLAGSQASEASYSTLIGFEAGRFFTGNNIGTNNIIIGNSISLPSGATNSMNIGGVLFGTGLNTASGSNPLITPVNGKIGVNVVSPSEALHVSGNAIINGNTTITGTTFHGGNTFSKAGYNTGDISLDNGATDTPGLLMYYANNTNWGIDSNNQIYGPLSGQLLRVVTNLNESGGSVKFAMDTTGNITNAGFISPGAWRAGQVIKDTMLSNTDITVSTTTIATSTSDTDFITYSYTPTSSSSYLIIHYHLGSYDATSGSGNDSWISRIKVDGNEISYSIQNTVNGFRTGVLFPLTGRYTNSNTTAKSIVVACRRGTADDSISIVNSSTSMWLRITEIAR